MSKARQGLYRKTSVLVGRPTLRPGNGRMFFQHDPRYQEETHANLNAALARGQLFVGYLATYPRLYINHSILVYKRKSVLRAAESSAISLMIPIIRRRRASLPGSPALGLLLIKKIGISLVASFASFKFTANRCSKNDSLNGEHQCQTTHHHLRRHLCHRLSLYRPIRRRFLRSAGKETERFVLARLADGA
jgi:hypothetical protein